MNLDIINNIYKLTFYKIKKLNKGYACEKWLVYLNKKEKYILKKVNNQNKQRVLFFLSVQASLKTLSVPVIKTKTNEYFFEHNNNLYYLCLYISNYKKKNSMHDLGTLLGITHKKMAKIILPDSRFLLVKNNENKLKEYLEYYKQKKEQKYVDFLNYKINILNAFKSNIDFTRLSEQIIHGDFYFDNVLWANNRTYLIDFDQSCVFYKEYEVMRAMVLNSTQLSNVREIVFKHMDDFIKAYLKNNLIKSPIDAYNIYLYVQANSLSCLNPDNYNDETKKEFANKRYILLRFLYENKREIIEILKGNYYEKA